MVFLATRIPGMLSSSPLHKPEHSPPTAPSDSPAAEHNAAPSPTNSLFDEIGEPGSLFLWPFTTRSEKQNEDYETRSALRASENSLRILEQQDPADPDAVDRALLAKCQVLVEEDCESSDYEEAPVMLENVHDPEEGTLWMTVGKRTEFGFVWSRLDCTAAGVKSEFSSIDRPRSYEAAVESALEILAFMRQRAKQAPLTNSSAANVTRKEVKVAPPISRGRRRFDKENDKENVKGYKVPLQALAPRLRKSQDQTETPYPRVDNKKSMRDLFRFRFHAFTEPIVKRVLSQDLFAAEYYNLSRLSVPITFPLEAHKDLDVWCALLPPPGGVLGFTVELTDEGKKLFSLNWPKYDESNKAKSAVSSSLEVGTT
ncbi:hypothetical protein FA15DRAFT_659414 [Coprinopsis marcescibilis]|uniref:Uncharacterized protein n=1 Tax=Coprinopsis marcescibilis TaxID=230819 RepID=A0A5C3KVS2_COPMA|nr:hypothetical protein FA15DRAFT_659414 [Coprinopsis marcescibilis]